MLIFDLLSRKYKVTCSVDSPLFKGLMCVLEMTIFHLPKRDYVALFSTNVVIPLVTL